MQVMTRTISPSEFIDIAESQLIMEVDIVAVETDENVKRISLHLDGETIELTSESGIEIQRRV